MRVRALVFLRESRTRGRGGINFGRGARSWWFGAAAREARLFWPDRATRCLVSRQMPFAESLIVLLRLVPLENICTVFPANTRCSTLAGWQAGRQAGSLLTSHQS